MTLFPKILEAYMENLFPLEVSVLSAKALFDFISREYFPIGHCRLFYRGLHDIYRVTTVDSEYFLKIYRQGLRRFDEIQAEMELLLHLKSSNVETTIPVSKCDGTLISHFHTPNGTRFGVMFTSVGLYGFDQVEESAEMNRRLGRYIASLHGAWDKCEIKFCRWNLDVQTCIDRSIEAIREFSSIYTLDMVFIENMAVAVKAKLAGLSDEAPQYGMCHGDIYGGNIRFEADNQPVLFDFDFCGMGWRAYDISMYAFPFGMGCDEQKFEQRERRKHDFLDGYNEIRTMNEAEIHSIACFIPFRRMFNMGTLYISYLQDSWGDSLVVRNVNGDIEMLKRWMDLNANYF
jgi:Ser/Thr protein kinase RdoA (MazF antagonist)